MGLYEAQRALRVDLQARLEEYSICAAEKVWSATREFESYYWSTDNIQASVEPLVVRLDTDDANVDDLFKESDEK